jgi:hypothetical protein
MWLNQASGPAPNSAANSLPARSSTPENSAAGGTATSSQAADIKPAFAVESAISTERNAFFPAVRETKGVRSVGDRRSIGTAHAIALQPDQIAGRYKHARRP